MTAINVTVKSRTVEILSDAAHLAADGRVILIAPKVEILPQYNCVIATRGPSLLVHLLAMGIGELMNCSPAFDALCQYFSSIAMQVHERGRPLLSQSQFGDFCEIYLAGWSEAQDRPCAYLVPSHDGYNCDPWTMIPVKGINFSPCDEALFAEVSRNGINGGIEPDDFDMAVHGMKVMELQRRHQWEIPGAQFHGVAVGGFAQLTSVMKGHIETRIEHRWPDKIGAAISPAIPWK